MMRRINFIKNITSIVALAALTFSCTENYKEWNTNPVEIPEEQLVGLMEIGGFFPTMEMDVIPTSDVDANEFQRAQNLCGDMHARYMTPIGTWGYSTPCHYNLNALNWKNVAFSVAFTTVMPAWKQIRDKGKEEYPEAFAVAQILKVETMHRIAEIYGPLPYLHFGDGNLETPYDSEEDIYKSFFTDLDAAIAQLQEYTLLHPNAKPLAKYDLVYGGDFGKWLKFANSLKLRLAMHVCYVDNFEVNGKTAQKLAEEAVSAGVITENGDNALLKSGNGISVFNPLEICWNSYSDTRMSAEMESIMGGYDDPRLPKFFQQSQFTPDDGTKYHGARFGVPVTDKTNYKKLSSPAIYASTPVQWMCAAEVALLRAEGAIRGWNMGGEAADLYAQGVTLSFEQWGATLGNYLQDETSQPKKHSHQKGLRTATVNAASTITIAWKEEADFEEKLERIITQKWIAMFPEGTEAWTEHRRTGYPKFFTLLSTNYSSNQVDSNDGPRRIPYPSTEYDTNTTEVGNAVSTWLGGTDYGKVKLWWDKKQ